jgi:hypothetical protein
MLDRQNPPTPNLSGHIPVLKKIDTDAPTIVFRELLTENRSVQFDDVLKLLRTLGKMLQLVPKEERKRTIARLLNVSEAHRKNGDSPFTYLTIEALVSGWEDWSNLNDELAARRLAVTRSVNVNTHKRNA